jgi:hypothetical protein
MAIVGLHLMPEICFSTSFTALKSRKFKQFMYFNPGRKYLLRNGENREGTRLCGSSAALRRRRRAGGQHSIAFSIQLASR